MRGTDIALLPGHGRISCVQLIAIDILTYGVSFIPPARVISACLAAVSEGDGGLDALWPHAAHPGSALVTRGVIICHAWRFELVHLCAGHGELADQAAVEVGPREELPLMDQVDTVRHAAGHPCEVLDYVLSRMKGEFQSLFTGVAAIVEAEALQPAAVGQQRLKGQAQERRIR